MPSNGKVSGQLVVQMDLQSAGFFKTATGVNKAIRSMRSNLKTLDKFYKANGDEVGRLSQKYKQSSQLMTTYQEKIKGLKSELKGLKPNTQAFVQQQNQIRRTEADMAQLSNEMKSYRKQLLYQDSALQRTNSKYKQQASVINSSISRYKAEGNALKQSIAERRKVKNSIDQHNASIRSNEKILNRIRVVMGKNSAEYAEQRNKLKALKAETAGYNAQLTQTTNKMKAMAVQQRASNTAMGGAMASMQRNKAGLIDMRNSFMGLTAAAVGMAFPVARALGGAVRATVQWEDAQSNVAKTTNASKSEMEGLSKSIRGMAKEMPESQSEIANTMAMAAQLGVKNLKGFTKVATQMSVATDMTAEEASTNMARFANATGKPESDFRRLGSTVVQLGNNMAAQESEIMNFAQRLAGTGTVVGVSQKDIMALSAAMASVGINAESGGSAMSKVLTKMNNAVKDGGEKLQGFASIAGVSGQEFAETWEKDPYKAVQQFEQGLAKQNKEGQNVKQMLKELGITELRETDTVLRLANGNKQLQNARQNANKGYKEGNALSKEAETKYKTLGNQMKIFMNHVRDLGIEIGAVLAPILVGMMKTLTPMIDALAKAPAPIKLMVVALALIPVVAVPVLASLAAITGAMGLMGQAMTTATFAAGKNSRALKIYSVAMGLLTSPISTVKKGLSSMPGLFWKTGGAAKGSSGGMKAAGTGMLSLLNPMKLVRGILPILSVGFKGLFTVFRVITGPIGLTVTAIMLLYKAFKSAYDNVEWFRKGIDGLVYTFKVFGGGIIGSVVGKIKDLGNWFSKTGSKIKDGFTKNLQESYKEMGNDVPFKKGVKNFKGIMQVLGEASKKASDSTKVLGKGVSKETKSALGSYVKYSNSSNKILEQVKLNHGDISKKKATELLSIEKKLTNDIVAKLEKRKQDELKNAQEVFENSKALSQKEKDAIIDGIKDRNDKAIQEERSLSAKIKAVKEAAMADGNISKKEMALIEKLEKQRRNLTVKNLTKTQEEQEKILSRMKNNREALSVSEASSAIKQAEKARKARVKEIKDEYDDKVYAIDQMVGLSKEQKQKLLDEAEDEKNKQINKANEKKEGVVKSVKDQNKDIDKEMDTSNGKVYTKAEKWWKLFKDGLAAGFGKWGASIKKNFQKSMDSIMSVGSDIQKVKQSADKFWNNFGKAFMDGMSRIGSWISGQTGQFGTALVNGIMNIGSWIMQVKTKANTFWSQFGTTLAGMAGNIGSFFVSIGGKIWNGIKQGWNTSLATGGNLWSSLVSKLSLAWESTKGFFTSKGSNIWSSVKQGWNTSLAVGGNLWNSLTSKLGAAWGAIRTWFVTKGGQMATAVSTGWKTVSGIVTSVFGTVWSSVKVIWNGIWGTIRNITGLIWTRIKTVWNWIKTNTSNTFGIIWNTIKRIWTGIKGTIVYWTGAIWNRIKSVWTWIKTNTSTTFNWVWNKIKNIWKGIKGTIVYWTGAIWNRIKAVWGWIKSNTASAFTWVWNKIKSIWKGIKGTITYWTSAIWNRIKSVWGWIKSHTASVFGWIWNKIKSIWKGIKGTITYWTGAIWNRIKSIWNTIKRYTSNIFTAIFNTLKRIWTNIKNAVTERASAMWSKLRGTWNNLSKGTKNIFTNVKNSLVNTWQTIKDKVTGIASSLWGSVKKTFTNMSKGLKGLTGKIGGTISNMVKGVAKGLQKLIDGVNWVGDKLGMGKKMIPDIKGFHTGTEGSNSSVVSNGAISRPTLATVNDKGRGNGTGPSGHQEVIQKANGSMFAPQGKDVTVPLEKGDKVINGRSVQKAQRIGALPKFASGTGRDNVISDMYKDAKKAKRKKRKHDHVGFDAGEMMHSGQGGQGGAVKEAMDWIEDQVSGAGEKTKKGAAELTAKGASMLNTTKDALGAAGSWAKNKAGDLMQYMGNPGKLLDKVLQQFGVSFPSIKGEIPTKLWGGMWKQLKEATKSLMGGWLDDASEGDGDGKYIKYLDNITTPYSPNGPPKGYPFNWAHPGIDLPYRYEKVQTPLEGTVQTKDTGNVGFGHHVIVKAKPYDAIFGHMSKWAVKNGQHVNVGDTLGTSGNTGSSTGAHLHYEMNKHGKGSMTGNSIDPVKWLKSHNGSGSKNKKASAWKDDIKRAAKQMKVSLKGNDLNNIISLINAESGGNAGITQGNIGDINNRNGNPAQGLLQYIPQTFSAYAMKGHKNIKNGYDQLLAFFNNKHWRSQFNPNGGWSPTGPRRFAHGGMIKKHGLYEAGEGNREEMILPLTNKVRAMQLIEQAKSFMGVSDNGDISVSGESGSNDIIAQLMQQNNQLLQTLIGVVERKELVVDEDSLVNGVNNRQGNQYNRKSYHNGKTNK